VVPSPKENINVIKNNNNKYLNIYIYIYSIERPILPSFVGAISFWPSHQGQKYCLKKVRETYKRQKANS